MEKTVEYYELRDGSKLIARGDLNWCYSKLKQNTGTETLPTGWTLMPVTMDSLTGANTLTDTR